MWRSFCASPGAENGRAAGRDTLHAAALLAEVDRRSTFGVATFDPGAIASRGGPVIPEAGLSHAGAFDPRPKVKF